MTSAMHGLREPPRSQSSTFWTSLRYLADGRLIISLLLLIYIPVLGPDQSGVQAPSRSLFVGLTVFYLGFALASSVLVRKLQRGFAYQLFAQVTVDILMIGLIVYASDGRSGLGALMITPVAGAAILSAPRPSLAVAAAASLTLLGETAWRILKRHETMGASTIGNELMIAAFISASLFFTALVVNRLARRLAMQEWLAIRRGEDLRNQRAINALVVAELDQGVMVFDPRGVPKDMNPKARAMLKLPMGVPVSEADPRALAQLRQILDAPGKVVDMQIGGPGQGHWIRARVLTGTSHALRVDDGGEQPYYPDADNGRAGRALLDRVVLLEDLKRVEDRAQQLKLASMGRLSASIAHEIRNPLGAIRHAGNLLAEQVQAPHHKRLTAIIENSTLRIDRIIEDVLSMARRGATRESLSLPVWQAQFMPEFLADKQVPPERIVWQFDTDQPMLFDPNHLRQVMVNLLVNALRYASEVPGAIRVCWCLDAQGKAQLWVLDDGPGIEAAQRQHLFEPFFTTEARGTGLGLHMTQELCTANGASIRYELPGMLDECLAQGRHVAGFVITPASMSSAVQAVDDHLPFSESETENQHDGTP
ncbi:MAG: histidine kinase dimerization/phospho-acceptor domain-containing protein [Lautropia sp.]|nr:histidine kinase dimerization/phospho-acceptor domain-containing protein [Lautropia sp.]